MLAARPHGCWQYFPCRVLPGRRVSITLSRFLSAARPKDSTFFKMLPFGLFSAPQSADPWILPLYPGRWRCLKRSLRRSSAA